MKNISYFCSVKRTRTLIRTAALSVLFLITTVANAAVTDGKSDNPAHRMEISLLTCAPGQEVYSLYGHTAIKIDFNSVDSLQGIKKPVPAIANYGMFSFRKSFFVLRFIFGLTDYELGITDELAFCEEYSREGRAVIQQTLNLTTAEKESIWRELMINYMPENRTYRYNYFYDNCTTRARDILTRYINGRVVYQAGDSVYPSYREMIHEMNTDYPWARFGNDMLLGLKADRKTDLDGHQFLPFNLMHDFDKAKIIDTDGKERPLVKETKTLVDVEAPAVKDGFPLRPSACAWILLAVVVVVTVIEWRLRLNLWQFDTLLLIVAGCAGVILFLMLFSQHPTTSLNLQLLLLNPLPLVFLWRAVRRMRKETKDNLWTVATVLVLLFVIGGIWQNYAEGMNITTVALLVRCVRRLPFINTTKQ